MDLHWQRPRRDPILRICPECSESTHEEVCPNDGRLTVDAEKLRVPSRADSFVGTTIAGKYLIEERLGRGGYGAVYRARHVETAGEVAIKLVRADLVDDEMVIRRFYIEAQNTHKLHHPNTVRVSDFGRTPEGVLYLVMEYVKGLPLNKVIKKEAPLSPERAVRIAVQMLKALGEAHGHQLVHRDIKPQNIMLLDQFGEPDFVKVLDFGISRALDSTGASTQGLLGTPRYMAPEQWRSLPVDGRTDMYAVGCILYEMLTGRLPFDAPEGRGAEVAVGYMTAHVARPPVPIESLLPEGHIPASLASCVMQMLAKKKDDRPPSVHALLKHFAQIQREHRLSDVAPTPPGMPPTPGNGSPPSDTQTLDGELLEVGGIEESESRQMALSTELSGVPAISTRPRWLPLAGAAAVLVAVILGVVLSGDDEGSTKEPAGATASSQTAAVKSGTAGGAAVEEPAVNHDPAKVGAKPGGEAGGKASPAPTAEAAAAAEVAPAAIVLRTKPAGATIKTTDGILLGTSGPDGVKVTNPPLAQGQEVRLLLKGFEPKTVKIGFPSPGTSRDLTVALNPSPTLRFNLAQGIKVSIKETGSDLGVSPREYVLRPDELAKLRSARRLTLAFAKDGHVGQELVVDERKIGPDQPSIAATLSPVKKRRPTKKRPSRGGKKKKLPDWQP